jgi:hypothetical protein
MFLLLAATIFGKRVLGPVKVGDLFIDWDDRTNPFCKPLAIKKIIAISDTHLKYASYCDIDKCFSYERSADVKSFIAFHARTNEKHFADVLANQTVK